MQNNRVNDASTAIKVEMEMYGSHLLTEEKKDISTKQLHLNDI